MFLQLPDMEEYIPFIIAAVLLGAGVILFKIGLSITRAQERTNIKWVAISFFIQFGIAMFISTPLALDKVMALMTGRKYEGPQALGFVITVVLSIFILINMINLLHKSGIIKSIILILLVMGPVGGSIYLIFSGI